MFEECVKTDAGLQKLFCPSPNATCDEYFISNNLTTMPAIPGILSRVINGESSSNQNPLSDPLLSQTVSITFFLMVMNPDCGL